MELKVRFAFDDEIRCIFTGFAFEYDGKRWIGNLYKEYETETVCIKGINKFSSKLEGGESKFVGELAQSKNGYLVSIQGTLTLNIEDVEYITRS